MPRSHCTPLFHKLLFLVFLLSPLLSADTFEGKPVPDGFIQVNAGHFLMGPTPGEKGSLSSRWQYEVTLSQDFLMAAMELTVGEWNRVQSWAVVNGYTDLDISGEENENLPAIISWYQAVKWCNARSEKEGLKPVYTVDGAVYRTGTHAPEWDRTADGYRLPSEAEWEYATRAGTTTAFYTGDLVEDSLVMEPSPDAPVDPSLDRAGWYVNNSGQQLHAPGLKEPNPWGFYDQHGNVAEWCWDRVVSYPVSPMIDPEGGYTNTNRRIRGGNVRTRARDCRSASRDIRNPETAFGTGLRLVRGIGYGVGAEETQRVVLQPEVFAAVMEAELSGWTKDLAAWQTMQNAILRDWQISLEEVRFVDFIRLGKPEIAIYSTDGDNLIFHNNWEGRMGPVHSTPTAEIQRIWRADIPLIGVTQELHATLVGLNPSLGIARDNIQAGVLWRSILRDEVVDEGEFKMLEMMVDQKGDFYFFSGDRVPTRFKNYWRSGARNQIAPIFEKARAAHADYSSLWEGGAEGFAEMARIFASMQGQGAATADPVDFVAEQARATWAESTIENGYGPIRALIASRVEMANRLEEAQQAPARQLLYDGIKKADTTEDGEDGPIPNFLYNWIRPGGYLGN